MRTPPSRPFRRAALAVPLRLAVPGLLLAAAALARPARAEEAPAAATTPEPRTVAATKGPFAPEVEVAGAFEPREAVEVAFRPQAYGAELEVVEASSGGTVSKGAVLVRFDTEKVDEQIRAAEAEIAVARENLARLGEEAKLVEEATSVALDRAKADAARSDEALRKFREVEAPLRRQETEHRVQGSNDHIQDQVDELDQLKKMYEADEVTEETEDIVMKRAKRSLERSRTSRGFLLERQRLLLEVELPKELEGLELAHRKARVDWERARTTAPIALAASRTGLEKARGDFERQERALARLRADREAMTVVSPVSGVAVTGSFWDGKWHGLDDLAKALRPGRRAPANQPLYTVFAPGALRVRATVAEAVVLRVAPGSAARVTPNADPSLAFETKVSEVAPVSADGQYEVRLDVEKADPRLLPGHGAKVRFVGLSPRDALTLPTSAVRKEGEKGHLHVWADGKAVAKEVKLGGEGGGRVEVVEGLEAGALVVDPALPK
jgi:HlyD family secretion protein